MNGQRTMKLKDGLRKALSCLLAVAIAAPIAWADPVEDGAAEPSQQSAPQGLSVSLNWSRAADGSSYQWDATSAETRVVRLNVGYSGEAVDGYDAGSLTIRVPGIGGAQRDGVVEADDVAADKADATEKVRDWSYTWDAESDVYTFTNNNRIEAGEVFSGSFELLWEMEARETVDGWQKELVAESSAPDGGASSGAVDFAFSSEVDVFTLSGEYGAASSGDGLGDDADEYVWVAYDLSSTMRQLARGAQKAQLKLEAAPGAKLAYARTSSGSLSTASAGDGAWTVDCARYLNSWWSLGSMDVLVGWPKDRYAGQETELQATLSGRYYDETVDEVFARCAIPHVLNPGDFDFEYHGALYSVSKGGTYQVLYDDLFDGAEMSFSLSGTARGTGKAQDVALVDDFQRVMLGDGSYRVLEDEEWDAVSLTVPSASSLKDGNGFSYKSGELTAEVAVRMDGRDFDDWRVVKSVKVGASSQTIDLPAGNAGAMVTFLDVDGTIDISGVTVRTRAVLEDDSARPESSRVSDSGELRDLAALVVSDSATGKVLNVPGRDSYVGSDADAVADADLDAYGEYRQRDHHAVNVVTEKRGLTSRTNVTAGDARAAQDGYAFDATVSTSLAAVGDVEEASVLTQYALLPEGASVDEATLAPTYKVYGTKYANGVDLPEYWAQDHVSLDVVANWRGSGRTLVKATWRMDDMPLKLSSSSSLSMTFPVFVDNVSYLEFGDVYRVQGATLFDVESTEHELYLPAYDDGSWADGDGLWADLDEDGDEDERLTHDADTATIAIALASHREVTESVRSERSNGQWGAEATAALGEPYEWRLQMTTGNAKARDLVMFDSISGEGAWSGTFAGVDVSWLEGQGYSPVVWYSPDDAAGDRSDLSDGTWTRADEWQGDLAGVLSVAVELPGQTVPESSLAYAVIDMTAPVDPALVGTDSEDAYRSVFTALDAATGTELGDVVLDSPKAVVHLVENASNVTVVKLDAIDGRRLAGAVFDLADADGRVIQEGLVTNSQGEVTIWNLPYGDYQLIEREAPSGYVVASEPYLFTADAKEVTVEAHDSRTVGSARITKVDAKTGLPLSDAHFDVYRIDNDGTRTKVATAVTGIDGTALVEDLAWGAYAAVETECRGYVVDGRDRYFVVSASSASTAIDVVVENEQMTGSVELVKTEVAVDGTSTGKPIVGAVYDIVEADSGKVVQANLTTNEEGRIAASIKGFGKCEFVEKIAPTGYELNKEPIPFEISRENVEAGVAVTAVDHQTPGIVRIVKTDPEGNPLEGAVFSIYKKTTIGVEDDWDGDHGIELTSAESEGELVVEGLTTGVGGTASYEGLEWGDYYVVETAAPQGYEVDPTPRPFTVDHPSGSVVVRVEDGRQTGTVKVVKVDAEDDNVRLEGAKFSLYKDDGTLVRDDIVTGENGTALIDGLDWGGYYLVETEAPQGYSLSGDKVKFAVNAQNATISQEVTVEDDREGSSVTVEKRIDPDDVVWEHGDPAFTFKLVDDMGAAWYRTVVFDASMEPDANGMLTSRAVFSGLEPGSYALGEVGSVRYGERAVEAGVWAVSGDRLEGELAAGEDVMAGSFENVKSDQEGVSDSTAAVNVVGRARALTALTAEWTGGVVIVETEDASDFDAAGLYATAWFDDGTSMDVVVDGVAQPGASWDFDGLDAWTDGTYELVVSYESNGVKNSATVLVELDFTDPPAYALLYEDGTMVFQMGSDPDPARGTLVESWTDYLHTDNETWKIPWYFSKEQVTSVVFEDTIAPFSTSQWFNEMNNLKKADLSLLDASNVTDMISMFSWSGSLTELVLPESFDTSNVTDMRSMFAYCNSLTKLVLPESFNTSNVVNMQTMFSGCSSLRELVLPKAFDTSNVTDMNSMFYFCKSLEKLELSESFNTSKVIDMKDMFDGCSSLAELTLPESFDTSNVTRMRSMFADCSALTELALPESFDTSRVTDMYYMFFRCRALTELTLPESFDTSRVTSMYGMFEECSSLTELALPESFDTSRVTSMGSMFEECSSLTELALPESFDTSRVTSMRYMFENCKALTKLALPESFDTSRVTDMYRMFYNCKNLELDASSWNVSSVTSYVGFNSGASGVIPPAFGQTRTTLSVLSTGAAKNMTTHFWNVAAADKPEDLGLVA